jgi:hypothetical protein
LTTNLKDTVCDIAEVILDSQLQDGVLKEIPIVGWFFRAANSVITLQDRLFLRKISKFLSSLDDIQQEQRDNFIRKLDDDMQRQEVGEKVLLVLERQDDLTKAELIGEIFRWYIQSRIDRDHFDLLSHSITLSYVGDLSRLWGFKNGFSPQDEQIAQVLLHSGFVEMTVKMPQTIDDIDLGKSGVIYKLSSLGETLADILKERDDRLSTSGPN